MIQLRDVYKSFGPKEVLRGFSLDVPEGKNTVLMGFSGGGKSVTLKLIAGLLAPDSGDVLVDGKNVPDLDADGLAMLRREIAFVFQFAALFDSMTVEENIAFPLREAGLRDARVIRKKIAEMLEVIELEGEENKLPVNLSGGMKKRVGLARAIISQPACILYCEPTSGLDPIVSDSINRLIRRLQERYRVTSVVVTHDMKSAFHVGDHIAYLHEGRIYFHGTPAQLQASSDPIIQDFLIGRSTVAD